jgi:MFS family permease
LYNYTLTHRDEPLQVIICWFVLGSIAPIGAFLGSLCAGPLMQLLGRRKTLMLSSPVWVLAWSLVALAQNYGMMLFARMLSGFCVGLITPSAAVYVSCNFVIVHLIYVSCNFVLFVRSSKEKFQFV